LAQGESATEDSPKDKACLWSPGLIGDDPWNPPKIGASKLSDLLQFSSSGSSSLIGLSPYLSVGMGLASSLSDLSAILPQSLGISLTRSPSRSQSRTLTRSLSLCVSWVQEEQEQRRKNKQDKRDVRPGLQN
jgi:hypothetical protein